MPIVLPIFADEVSAEDAFYVLEICFFCIILTVFDELLLFLFDASDV